MKIIKDEKDFKINFKAVTIGFFLFALTTVLGYYIGIALFH